MPNFVNTTGYLNDSPHKNNPFNIIKSKVITMNGVNMPLLLRPNKGKSVIAMPNSGEYNFPKADYVFEKPLFQPGGAFNDCQEGFTWSVADQQCLPIDQTQASNFTGNRNSFITGAINPSGQRVGGVGAQPINQGSVAIDENQNAKLKRVFGTPNIPAIAASNLLGFGLATFANNMEQGRQKAFMMKQMNNPLFNGSYSNAQNDYGVDPYEQTGQLRQFQKGGEKKPIIVNDKNDPRLRAYNDSLKTFNSYEAVGNYVKNLPYVSGNSIQKERELFNKINSQYPSGNTQPYRTDEMEPIDKEVYHKDGKNRFIVAKAKKPVQPVIYQQQPKSNIKSNELIGYSTNEELYKLRANPNMEEVFADKGQGKSLGFRKKVVPIPKQPEEKKLQKPIPINNRKSLMNFSTDGRPTPDAPPEFQVAQYDNTKPTKYSFSYSTGKYNEQKSIYFPDAASWKEFIGNQKLINSDEGEGYGTATGNLKFQKGGGVRDYLFAKGIDGSYESRKKLFGKYFDNYSGTAEQNISLMQKLQSGEIKLNGSQTPTKRYENNIPKTLISNPEDRYQLTPVLNIKPPVKKAEQKPVQKVQPKVVLNNERQFVGAKATPIVQQASNNAKSFVGAKAIPAPVKTSNKVVNNQKPQDKSFVGDKAALKIATEIVLKNPTAKTPKTGNATVDYYIDQIIKSGGKKILITDRGAKKTYYGTPDNIKSFDVLTGKNDDPKYTAPSPLSLTEIDRLKQKEADLEKVTPLGKFKLTRTNLYGAPALSMGSSNKSAFVYHTVYPGELKQRMAAMNTPSPKDNNMSYGCINCKKPDVEALYNMFNDGDESYTIDSRLSIPEIDKALQSKNLKKRGGFFQKGGSFNPVEYLYGDDDDKEQPKKQEEVVAKKKRITEEDIDNSSEELRMLGLSEEDILGMISPTRRKRQSFQADSAIPNSSGVNPFVLKTQKDIFNQFQGVTNLGVWGDKSHQQRKSDHNSGDAQDFGIKDIESGNAIANKLIAEAKERGVKYIVFNKKIWNPSISNEWRPYKGSNPHKTHVHVSYNKDLKMYEQGGEYVVDFATMKELQSKGIKFKML